VKEAKRAQKRQLRQKMDGIRQRQEAILKMQEEAERKA